MDKDGNEYIDRDEFVRVVADFKPDEMMKSECTFDRPESVPNFRDLQTFFGIEKPTDNPMEMLNMLNQFSPEILTNAFLKGMFNHYDKDFNGCLDVSFYSLH